ncbi:MAG TPA: hypothetical protein VHF27_07885 [Acidimicrobiales bacterium]|nr:hypothetical protein [Acidimicrobiales bacterium]
MPSVRLHVSGLEVEVRQPAGAEDVLLAEAWSLDAALAVELVSRVAAPAGAGAPEWADLVHTDLDALLLVVRATVFGDVIRSDVVCPAVDCQARADITFGIGDYLRHHRPRPPRRVHPAAEPGWYLLDGAAVRFRLPTAADLLAAAAEPRPDEVLRARTTSPSRLPAPLRRRVDAAMAALAPPLVDDLLAACPECHQAFTVRFDPREYCLRELRAQALSVFEDVHLLASAYNWPEQEILALPRSRRLLYAEMAREERGPA